DKLGTTVERDIELGSLRSYIDWTPFFHVWELKGKYPSIFDNPDFGDAARELYDNAQLILDRIIDEKLLQAHALFGFFPANSDGDDVIVYSDDTRTREWLRFYMLRQQIAKASDKPNYSLADFIAPVGSEVKDYLGAFVVSAGFGTDELAAQFEADHDDYNSIMVKALADRLAEALAEKLHEEVRQHWGYGLEEHLTTAELIKEAYRGIRPAPGYPACPDHTEKRTLWELLDVDAQLGIRLTTGLAMIPAASVCGFYFSHPEARYFNVGLLGRDQIESYAARKGLNPEEIEHWLSPNLGYSPD
ncbi:MAG: methionine synthase, partial [Myxococcales bacterium]|nr:methionine synthase [Myxococcales bacterium]